MMNPLMTSTIQPSLQPQLTRTNSSVGTGARAMLPQFAGRGNGNNAAVFAERFLIDFEKWGEKAASSALLKSEKGIIGTILEPFRYLGREVIKRFAKHDYHEFGSLGSLKISEPSPGALLFILYPFTMGARLKQAIQRAPVVDPETGRKDMREFGDVLRRDGFAITTFLFGMPIVQKFGLQLMEKISDIKLLLNGSQVKFDSLGDAYYLNSADRLQQLLDFKNHRQGLVKAVDAMDVYGQDKLVEARSRLKTLMQNMVNLADDTDRILGDSTKDSTKIAKSQLQSILEKVGHAEVDLSHLGDDVARSEAETLLKGHIKSAAEKAFAQVEHMNSLLEPAQKDAVQGFLHYPKSLIQKIFGMQDYKAFIGRYAKLSKLPVEIAAFGIIVALLGYGPVAFNDLWATLTFQKQREQAHGKGTEPKPTAAPTNLGMMAPAANPFQNPGRFQPGIPISQQLASY